MKSDDFAWALPHPTVAAQFGRWVVWDDGCDELGNFLAWCPLHDPNKVQEGSAEFNFMKGVFRCAQGKDGNCHPGKRAMSLTNLLTLMRSDRDE